MPSFADILRLALQAHQGGDLHRAVELYRREGDGPARVNLKLFVSGEARPLSDRVPLLENLGFRVLDERTYRIAPQR